MIEFDVAFRPGDDFAVTFGGEVPLDAKMGQVMEVLATEERTVELSMPSGNQVILPTSSKGMRKVTIQKPDTLLAENIKIGCCPFCGGNIKRANMKAFSRQSQIYGFNLALDGVDATWGALIYNFSAELELSAEQTAKLTTLGEEYDKMIRSFREADLPPEEFAEYVVAKAEECKARLKERWG